MDACAIERGAEFDPSRCALVSKTYTFNVDFDLGFFVNTNDTTMADQVQLAPASSPGPMPIFRAPLNAQNQLVYVDTNANTVIGRYQVAPTNSLGIQTNPQTVWVDLYGNTWVGNELTCDLPSPQPTGGGVTKIGIIIGGTRCDATGAPTIFGGYLKPPFTYNSGVVDRDGDGLIRTFNILSDPAPLPWINVTDITGGPDARTVDNVDDFILVYQRTTGAFAFGLCSDPSDESIWVGTDSTAAVAGHSANQVNQLNNYTGAIISTITPALFGAGTGARGGMCNLIDASGVLWSSSRNGPVVRSPAPFGPATSTLTIPTNCNNGQSPFAPLCIDGNGKVWVANIRNPLGALPITVWRLSALGVQEGEFNINTTGFIQTTQSMVCRFQDNSIWVASSGRLHHVNNAGALVAPVVDLGSAHIWGVMDIDANGKVWIVDCDNTTATKSTSLKRYNPTTHGLESNVVLSATVNNNPMGMSSPMGNARLGIGPPVGFWDVVYDAGSVLQWGIISWHESVPVGSAIKVEYRIANTELQLQLEAFATASNGVQFSGRTGQFVEVRVTLRAPVGSTNTPGVDAPALLDLTIQETNVPTEIRLGQGGTEFLYRHVSGLTPVPVPEVRITQAAFECLYRSSVDMRLGQSAFEALYAPLLSGPPLVGCGTGLVSFVGADQGQVSPAMVAGPGSATFPGGDQGQVSCKIAGPGVVSFAGADQGQLACP